MPHRVRHHHPLSRHLPFRSTDILHAQNVRMPHPAHAQAGAPDGKNSVAHSHVPSSQPQGAPHQNNTALFLSGL